ncbi:dolichol kinase [Methanohalophilus levihalophilus]|nr:dolichol kinase [Methanohalophilus levihalophilus]
MRKIIHIGGVALPFIAHFYGQFPAIMLLVLSLVGFLLLELLKSRIKHTPFAKSIWKSSELNNFALDPFLYAISVLLLLLLSYRIEPALCYVAIVVLSVGDSMAALVGFFGRIYIKGCSKTLEGTIAGFVTSSFIGYWFAGEIAVVGCAAGMITELFCCKYDNLAIPFAALFAMIFLKTSGLT